MRQRRWSTRWADRMVVNALRYPLLRWPAMLACRVLEAIEAVEHTLNGS